MTRGSMLSLSAGLIGLFLNQGPITVRTGAERSSPPEMGVDRLLVFVIDYEHLMCGGCHATILAFLAELQSAEDLPEAPIIGVLRLAPAQDRDRDSDAVRIASQKLAAFRRFNRIPFPILVSDCRICAGPPGAPGVTLLDADSGAVKHWTWPAAVEHFQAIIRDLRSGIDAGVGKNTPSPAKPH